MNKKVTRIVLELTDQEMNVLNTISEKKMHRNRTETVRYCLGFVYEKMNPAYVDRKIRQTPEEKALDKVLASEKAQELKRQRDVTAKTNICNFLGGEVVNLDGHLHCRYNQYQEAGGKKVDVGIITEPLEYLTEETINCQYQDLMGNKGPEARIKLQNLMKNN